jgi:phosphopantetheinyl transferase
VICSETKEVAIDIEVIQAKILKLKTKFFHPLDYEQGSDVEEITAITGK